MKTVCLIIALFSQLAVSAQILSTTVQAAAGTIQVAASGNAILSFTLGETAIATLTQTGISYGQGFHNGVTQTVTNEELDLEAWQLRLFPNPVSQTLSLRFSPPAEIAPLRASVWNLLGQCIREPVLLETTGGQTIDVGQLTPGLYRLQLDDQSGRRGSIPFVKM